MSAALRPHGGEGGIQVYSLLILIGIYTGQNAPSPIPDNLYRTRALPPASYTGQAYKYYLSSHLCSL